MKTEEVEVWRIERAQRLRSHGKFAKAGGKIIKTRNILTHERLLQVLTYNSETGLFYWNIRLAPRSTHGWFGGSPRKSGCNDYLDIRIDGKLYQAHRLAWFYITGDWPKFIDHANHIGCDNRWINLREANKAENSWNTISRNPHGLKGVLINHKNKQKPWRSQIQVHGKVIYLGSFRTKEEAHAAYVDASKEFHGPFGCIE